KARNHRVSGYVVWSKGFGELQPHQTSLTLASFDAVNKGLPSPKVWRLVRPWVSVLTCAIGRPSRRTRPPLKHLWVSVPLMPPLRSWPVPFWRQPRLLWQCLASSVARALSFALGDGASFHQLMV